MFFNRKTKLLKAELLNVQSENTALREKYADLIDRDDAINQRNAEIGRIDQMLIELDNKFQGALKTYSELEKEINLYQESLEVGSFGLYTPQFSFDTSEKYKNALEKNYVKQKALIKDDKAAICTTEWTIEGSKAEGRKMTNQYKKLMLFAFNGECDGLMAKVKWNNANKTKERILKAFENINKLGITHRVSLTESYLNLKLEELALTYEYEEKKYQEKEEQRLIREQMREEERAQKELEKAQKDAADEERRYQGALEKARQELSNSTPANIDILTEKVRLLESQLESAHERKERAIAMAQLTKVGHIYVISNLGSFGEDVYKIGMTRRLDPMDRVRELGDASVPFHFDVHAIIYSENAPQLEAELHRKFHERRLNRINNKKEFFRVTLNEIEEFVTTHANCDIQFTKMAEAREYRETLTMSLQFEALSTPYEEKSNKYPVSLL